MLHKQNLETKKVKVPRCVQCKRAHRRARVAKTIFWLTGISVGVFIAVTVGLVYWVPHVPLGPIDLYVIPLKPAGLLAILALIVLPFVGIPVLVGAGGSALFEPLLLGRAQPESMIAKYEAVEALQSRGWMIDPW